MSAPTYGARWPAYAKWWNEAHIRPQQAEAVRITVVRLMRSKSRYQNLEKLTGVPWMLIAALHEREGGGNFNTQLGQGWPLHQRSRDIPYSGPFATFEDSAVWALHHDGLDHVIDWRIEKQLYFAELWNGWGYYLYHPATPSPYIVGATTVQRAGKYVSDGVWSSSAWDTQIGVMAMLIEFARQDASIHFVRETPAGTPGDEAVPSAPPIPRKVTLNPEPTPPKEIKTVPATPPAKHLGWGAGAVVAAGAAAHLVSGHPLLTVGVIVLALAIAGLVIEHLRSKP